MTGEKPASPEFERLTEKRWHQEQTWCYEALYAYGKQRLKIDITRNVYVFQSHLRLKIYDAESCQWNMLVTDALTPAKATYRSSAISAFREDAESLLQEAKLILDC